MTARPFSALVLGASGGIGAALVSALRDDPACTRLVALSRRDSGLDITSEDSIAEAAARIGAGEGFSLIVNAAGVLETDGQGPEKSFRDIDPGAMSRVFAVNAIGAALAFKHFGPLLAREGRTVFAALSARVGSIGDNRLGGWMSYRASKAALNQIVRCAAIEETRRNRDSIVVALHPGTIETSLTRKYARGKYTASPREAAQNLLAVTAALSPSQSGGFFDYAGDKIAW